MATQPDTPFVTGETFEQLLADAIWVTPQGGTRKTLAQALAAAAGGTVTQVVVADGPFLAGATITTAGTVASSVNPTAHGILIGQGVSAVSATAALTSGQILVGQGATSDPLPRTVSGDLTADNTGAFALIESGVTAGTYGSASNVAQLDIDATGRVLSAVNVPLGIGTKLVATLSANGAIGVLPAGAMLIGATMLNAGTVAINASIGTTSGGNDVVDITAVPTLDIQPIPPNALLLSAFTANQTIYAGSSAWGGGTLTFTAWFMQ